MWVDDDDDSTPQPAFLKQTAPEWSRKRARQDLDGILSSTAPLADDGQPQRPVVAASVRIPRDVVRGLSWHASGEVVAVASSRSLMTVFASGRHADVTHTTKMDYRRRLKGVSVLGDTAMAWCDGEFAPLEVDLHTGSTRELRFLDIRLAAPYRPGVKNANDHVQQTFAQRDGVVGVCYAESVGWGDIRAASVVAKVHVADNVVDVCVVDAYRALIATRQKLLMYDTRNIRSHEVLRCGEADVTSVSWSGGIYAVGTESGVVAVYDRQTDKCVRQFKQLRTAISGVQLSREMQRLLWFSSEAKGAIRVASTQTHATIPGFPGATAHGFIHSASLNTKSGLLAVGEVGSVTLYQM